VIGKETGKRAASTSSRGLVRLRKCCWLLKNKHSANSGWPELYTSRREEMSNLHGKCNPSGGVAPILAAQRTTGAILALLLSSYRNFTSPAPFAVIADGRGGGLTFRYSISPARPTRSNCLFRLRLMTRAAQRPPWGMSDYVGIFSADLDAEKPGWAPGAGIAGHCNIFPSTTAS
jgi:hypothetical protein